MGIVHGGIHSLKDKGTVFFAKRIATSTSVWQVQVFGGWLEILSRVKTVRCINSLQSPECEVFVKQVGRFIRSGDCGRDLTLKKSGIHADLWS